MKTEFWLIGKSESTVNEYVERYSKRVKRYLPFSTTVLNTGKTKSNTAEQIKKGEATVVLSKLTSSDYLVLLDEHGKKYSSIEFANWLNKHLAGNTQRLIFLVGGAYGFDKKIYERANESLSLSKMTFSHQIIRILFMEQLYRGFAILNNEPYHHA